MDSEITPYGERTYVNMIGIYAVYNIYTKQIYIGSAINTDKRIGDHFNDLKKGKHINTLLQEDFNKWEEIAFRSHILEETSEDNLLEREKCWYNRYDFKYNNNKPNKSFNFDEGQILDFWSGVKIKGIRDCWIWSKYCDKDGYGKYHHEKQGFRANRIAYFLSNPNDNINSIVCHSCDNPSCCNPKHLFLGSVSKNHKDKMNKGRGCIINIKIAEEIRKIYKETSSRDKIIKYLDSININFSRRMINKVLRGETFSENRYTVKRKNSKISKETIAKIRSSLNGGLSVDKTAKLFNVSFQVVYYYSKKVI